MTYADQFPKPEGEAPPVINEGEVVSAIAQGRARDKWIIAHRKYVVATAVDLLLKKSSLTPAESISMVMGLSWLDGSLAPGSDLFGLLFGG